MPMRITATAQMSVAARRPCPRNRHVSTRNPRPAMIGTAARTMILARSESDGGREVTPAGSNHSGCECITTSPTTWSRTESAISGRPTHVAKMAGSKSALRRRSARVSTSERTSRWSLTVRSVARAGPRARLLATSAHRWVPRTGRRHVSASDERGEARSGCVGPAVLDHTIQRGDVRVLTAAANPSPGSEQHTSVDGEDRFDQRREGVEPPGADRAGGELVAPGNCSEDRRPGRTRA